MKDLFQTCVLALHRFDWGKWITRALIGLLIGLAWTAITLLVVMAKVGNGVTSGVFIRSALEVAGIVVIVFVGIQVWKRAVKWAINREQLPILVAQKLEGSNADPGNLSNISIPPWQNSSGTTTQSQGGRVQSWSKSQAVPRP